MRTQVLKNEIAWLSRHYKHLPVPVVVWAEENDDYYGQYFRPNSWEYFTGQYLDGQHKGVIEVCGEYEPTTITHEYRHHVQYFRHGTHDPSAFDYSRCPFEFDARSFELSLVGESRDECLSKRAERGQARKLSKIEAIDLRLPVLGRLASVEEARYEQRRWFE
jgi:hypothetical protein